MANRAHCPMCGYRVRLRRWGRVGAHRYAVFDGYGPALRSQIGVRQCSGAGMRPEDVPSPGADPGPLVDVAIGYLPSDWGLSSG